VWNAATEAMPLVLASNSRVYAAAFSPDGRRVAAGFASDGYTAVWEVPEGEGR
jgi:hypothetical protein